MPLIRLLTSVVWWALALVFALITLSAALQRSWSLAALWLLLTGLCAPPAGRLLARHTRLWRPRVLRLLLVAALLVAVGVLVLGPTPDSIYRTPGVRARFEAIYDATMKEWPVPYEDVFVDTGYGRVHVIVSGLTDGPPLLLLHASGVASWSWKFNIEELGRHYRCFAIDLLGDAGRSEYTRLDHVVRNGREQADLYAAITERLGVGPSFVAGASEGGFIASNFARYHPDRVRKLALLGPMGYAGATQAILRIVLAQLFPVRALQERTFAWAFSEDPGLQAEFGEWFRLVMSGLRPVKVAPWPFSAAERREIAMPVLFVFGTRDRLVGDADAASRMVQDVPHAQVRIVDAGHLMAAEAPREIDDLLRRFFDDP